MNLMYIENPRVACVLDDKYVLVIYELWSAKLLDVDIYRMGLIKVLHCEQLSFVAQFIANPLESFVINPVLLIKNHIYGSCTLTETDTE